MFTYVHIERLTLYMLASWDSSRAWTRMYDKEEWFQSFLYIYFFFFQVFLKEFIERVPVQERKKEKGQVSLYDRRGMKWNVGRFQNK